MAYKHKEIYNRKQRKWNEIYRSKHRETLNEYGKTYHQNHRDTQNEWAKNYRKRNKVLVIGYYSNGTNQCARCGYKDMRALQIDHVNGGGEEHRRVIKQDFYVWLIKNSYPEGYQVLCANCQILKMDENNERANKWTRRHKDATN
jgi:hypothetical protein